MFNSRPAASSESGSATGARNTPFSLIGSDVTVTGNINATVDLHVDGRIEGDVACATLVQGTESAIKGNVVAQVARIAGTIEGSVSADELIVERSARIVGDCSYGSLKIDVGATVEGRFNPKSAVPALKVVASAEG